MEEVGGQEGELPKIRIVGPDRLGEVSLVREILFSVRDAEHGRGGAAEHAHRRQILLLVVRVPIRNRVFLVLGGAKDEQIGAIIVLGALREDGVGGLALLLNRGVKAAAAEEVDAGRSVGDARLGGAPEGAELILHAGGVHVVDGGVGSENRDVSPHGGGGDDGGAGHSGSNGTANHNYVS